MRWETICVLKQEVKQQMDATGDRFIVFFVRRVKVGHVWSLCFLSEVLRGRQDPQRKVGEESIF